MRDMLLEREKINPDIDFCLKKGALCFARALAKKIKSGFVVLDKERGYCRLVKRIKDRICTIDFTDFRGKNLEDDLGKRDFTINAMALEVSDIFTKKNISDFIIDPYKGKEDLRRRLIRLVNKKGFVDDPLRILRAFSLAAIFCFKIEEDTIKSIRRERDRLANISGERIRDELFKILGTRDAFRHFCQMDKLKVLRVIIPEIDKMRNVYQGPYHHLDILRHSLETLRQMEILLDEFKNNSDVSNYLNENISSDRRRYCLIKLGAFLHDIGKPYALRRKAGKIMFHGHEKIGAVITEEISNRLKLANDEIDALNKMVFWHLRPGYLGDSEEPTSRAKFRYFRDTAKEAVSVLLISIADQRSTRGPLTTRQSRLRHEKVCNALIKEYFRKLKEKKPPRLITGDDLIEKFKLTPSPLIGKILREIEELQAIGKIKTKAGALKAVRGFIGKYKKYRKI